MAHTLFDLSGKVALITGASSGLGVQFARALAKRGAQVAITARRIEKLKTVKAELTQMNAPCIAIQGDVTNERLVKETVQTIIEKWGKIDILVNNAGTANTASAEQLTMSQWDEVLNTNLRSMFMVSREVGKQMIKQQYGKIINISSMFGLVANSAFPVAHYHASKHGVIGLTRALAAEWAPYNITVNAIAPGFFESEMTEEDIQTDEFKKYLHDFCPMKRIGRPGELDGALVYLAADASCYTTGQVIVVDGGWTAL